MNHFYTCVRSVFLMILLAGSLAGYSQVTVEATIGTTGPTTYTNLGFAFAAINSGTHKGVITIKITGSTNEGIAQASLSGSTASSSTAPYYTSINIYPTTTGLSISGAVANNALINLNGADNVTIDGRVNATGSTKSLTITNTSTSSTAGTSTIRFINDASSNTVKYCTLKGSSTDAAAGIVFFSTTTGSTGNDNNSIDNNDITNTADASRPLNAVYALGTSLKDNSGNTISNNNIYDFLSRSTASQGINISSNNSAFTISDNSFYETASFTASAAVNYNVILINTTATGNNGFTVSGNYIGGNAALCGGSAWTKTGTVATTHNNAFTAISVTTATGTANSIQGNTIQNFSWTNTGTSDFTGISLSGATVANIGTVTGNLIGAATGTGSITFTSTTTATDFFGINISSTDVVSCQNNTIGSITAANASTNATNFFGIFKASGAGTTTISGNTIGSTATASSINASSASSTAANIQSVYGIQSAGSGTVTISGNTVANLVNATTNGTTTTAGLISGIYVSAGTNTITGNTVWNLSNANANNSISNTASVSGIVMASTTAAAQTVSTNTVYNLSNSNTGFTGGVIGIYYAGPTTPSTVSRNFIHSLSVSSSTITADLYGIKIATGTTTYSNNIISLGGDTQTDIFGIFETGSSSSHNNSLYFNTIYISGSMVSGAANFSYALYSAVTTNTRNFRNNVLVNARSTVSGTSKHYALYIVSSGGTITLGNNNYYVSGTGGVLGYVATNKTSLPLITSNDANSINTDPAFSGTGTTAGDYTPSVRGTGVTGTGITVDYTGFTRGSSVSMGAIEISGVPPQITSFSPASAKPGDAVTLSGIRFNATAANNIVFFGATRATVTSASATSVTLTVPTGATYAPITLLNTTSNLACASLARFNPVYEPAKSTIAARDFATTVDFATGSFSFPYSVAIGDLDGDGKADLAVANNSSNTVSVFRNTSTSGSIAASSFDAKVDFTTGSGPYSLAIGDLDGDGKPELAVAHNSFGTNSVSVFRNTSTSGTVSFAAKVDLTTGSSPYSVAIGDLDGDGKSDLAVANYNSTSVSVFRNTSTSGTVSFAAKVDFTAGSNPISVAIGDLDGDGKADLAVANSLNGTGGNSVSVFRNTSTSGSIAAGSFAAKVDLTTGSSPYSVAIGDLDGDGKPDLAVANYNSTSVSVFRNTSTSGSIVSGSFATKVDFTTGTNPGSVAIGDLDGDGKVDLAVANYQSTSVSVFRNTSSSGSITSGSFAIKVDFSALSNPNSVAIGDLDGDGMPELAAAFNGVSKVSVFRNVSCLNPSSGGTIAEAQSGNAPFDPSAFTSTAAASGHYPTLEYKWQSSVTSASAGFSDIASSNSATYDPGSLTQTTWFKRLARASCQSDWTGAAESNVLQITAVGPVITSFSPATAKPGDAVTLTGTGFNATAANNVVFFGATRGTVTSATATSVTVTVPTGATYGPITLLNTASTLACASLNNFNPVYDPAKSNLTAGDFSSKMDFTAGSDVYSVAIGDLDGDGKADLAVANFSSATVSVLRNTSTSGRIVSGSFATKQDFATGSRPVSVAIGDLDGDGKPDLAVANNLSSSVSVFRNTSTSGSIDATSFATKVDFTTGSNPQYVTIGDLDGNGKPDLAVANGAGTVSVIRNTSTSGNITSGSFAAKLDFTTGSQPYYASIGDLDGDGEPDLAVVNNGSNTVSVFRNTSTIGSVSFASKVDFTTGTNPRSVAIGDLDGDGKAELAVTNFNSANISIFRNISTSGSIAAGSFDTKVDFTTGTSPYSVAIGDLDGDGKPDLSVANFASNTVSVFRNNSVSGSITNTSFGAKVDFGTGTSPYSVAIGDLDGDGRPDLAVANGGFGANSVSVFYNADYPPVITSFSPASAKPGDAVTLTGIRFNATAANNIVFFGATRGTVTAASATSVTVTVPVGATHAPISLLNSTTALTCASLTRFNPVYEPAKSTILASDFATKVDFTTGTGAQPISTAIGDLDGDGKADLAVANWASNTVSVFRNTSTSGSIEAGSFAAKVDFTTGSRPYSVAIGDLDGDGKADLAVANWFSNNVSVFHNTSTSGTVSFSASVDFTTGARPRSVAIGDLDGDGKPELAVTSQSSFTVSVFRNISKIGSITSGSFATKVDFSAGSNAYSVAIGDLDGDGKPDIAVTNNDNSVAGNSVSVFRNTSTSGSITTSSFAGKVDFLTGTLPWSVAIGDLDGDGKADLAVVNTGSNSVSVLRNTSTSGSITTSSFAGKVDFTTGTGPRSVAIGDLDGDGKADLAVANFNANSVSVFRNTSTSGSIVSGSFAGKVDFTTGTAPYSLAIGDLDGDGKPDLAVPNSDVSAGNSVSVMRNADCTNPGSGGTIAADQSGSSPFNPAAFTSSAAASGHTGTLEYKWQSSTTSATASDFSDIAGATSATYDPGALTQTTWFRRLARVSCRVDWTGAAVSNVLQVTVTSLAVEPTAQPTLLYFTNTGTNPYDFVGRFTASASATGYLVVRNTGSAPTFTPADGTSYTIGSQTGGTIVYVGSATTFTETSVTTNTAYHYAVYAYNGSASLINYLSASPLSGQAQALTSSSGTLGSSGTATSLGFPAAGATVNFPAGTSGTTVNVTKTSAAPLSNIQVSSSIRGMKPLYFSITSSTASPGGYTLILDFSGLGALTPTQWNSYKVTKRANANSPWVDITTLGATIVNRQTDGTWGKFTITGLSSFSDFGLAEAYAGVLVSNLAEANAGVSPVTNDNYNGQAFVTDGIRYQLSKVKVSALSPNTTNLRARLYGSTAGGEVESATILANLGTPTQVGSTSVYELTPTPATVKLEPNTQYWIVFYSNDANPIDLHYTTSKSETGPASFPTKLSVASVITSACSCPSGSSYQSADEADPYLFSIEATEVSRTWTGASTTAWGTAANWTPSETPGNGEIMTIPNVANDPVLLQSVSPANLFIESGAVVTLGDKNLTVTQGLSQDGTISATTGKLIMAGTSAQGLVGTGTIRNLEINNAAGVFISGGSYMQTITGKLTPTAGTLTTNGNLTLRSDVNGTARVGVRVGGDAETGVYISGNVVTQRYLSKLTGTGRNGRAWRLVTIPVTGTGTLRDVFMAGQPGTDLTVSGNRSAQPNDLGTVVIGHNQPDAATATGAGYDWIGTANQVSSLRYYHQNATNGSFASSQVPTLTTTYTSADQGYMLFARGDRQQTYQGTGNASATVLQATGALKQGTINVTIPALASAGFVLVGNPYMAVLDLEKVILDNAGVIGNTVYVWDANIDGNAFKQGGYRAVTRTTPGTWSATGSSTGANPQYIESGSAFFVKPTASGGMLSIKEAHKVDGTPGIAPHSSMTDGPSRLFINLEVTDTANRRLVDGAVAFFDDNYNDGLGDPVDIAPMTNLTAGTVTLRHAQGRLSMEGRPWPADSAARTIPVDMRNLGDDTYELRILPTNMNKEGFTAWLKDRHLNKETSLKLDAETLYPFRRTGDLGIDSSRFEIVYRLSKPTNVGTLTPDDAAGEIATRLYPNPAKAEDVKLALGSLAPGRYEVQVLDISGRLVLTKTLDHLSVNGEYRILEGRILSPGTYIIKLSDQNKQPKETLRLVVE